MPITWSCPLFHFGLSIFLFLPNVSFPLCRIMPKARTRTSRQRQVGPAAGPSRTRASPRASVRASSAASAGTASGAPAGTTPNTTPETDGASHTQMTTQEALLSSQFMETLVNRVADEVSRRLAPAPTPPVPTSDLQEIPAGPLPADGAPTPVDALARNIVQGTLQKESAAITGLPQQSSNKTAPHIPGQLFQSVSLPVDARLSDKLRTKIWGQEYVDFGSLLTNQVLDNQYQITVQNTASDTAPSLCIEPVTKPKKITSIEAWINSFHVFVGVYTKKFPHEAPALMKYGEIIQDLAVRGHNWKFYDENFRFLRQAHGALLPWDRIHGELWLKSQNVLRKTSPPQFSAPQRTKPDSIPKGYCFRFHKGRKCPPGCAFKHLCYRCEGSHVVTKCDFRDSAKLNHSQPQAAKSFLTQPSHPSKS